MTAGFDVDAAREAAGVLRDGRPVVLLKSRERDSEGNVVLAAQFATASTLRFVAEQAHGLIRLALSDERCEELRLGSVIEDDTQWQPTASITIHNGPVQRRVARRSCSDDPGRDRRLEGAGGVHPARSRVSAARAARWRAPPLRAHRGRARSRAACRVPPRRRDVARHERRRLRGPRKCRERVRRAPRPAARRGRRRRRAPPPEREARRSSGHREPAHRVRGVHGDRLP